MGQLTKEVLGAVSEADPGDEFGRFVLLDKLGGGAMAEVYRAHQTGPMGFRKEVALKRIRPDVADEELRTKMLEGLTNEARLGAHLHHRNVVEVYDFGQIGQHFYIAMELVHGITLERILRRVPHLGPIPRRIVCQIALQICAGLADAHGALDDQGAPLNLVHRDLKPANVMIDREGVVKIMDFGVARAQSNIFQTEVGTIKGTPTFMSPEQLQGQELDHRSDLFSLGALLAEMITGQCAFDAPAVFDVLNKIASADAGSALEAVEDRFPEMVPVIAHALQLEPEDRFQSAEEMAAEIEAIFDSLPGEEELVAWIDEWIAAVDSEELEVAVEDEPPPSDGRTKTSTDHLRPVSLTEAEGVEAVEEEADEDDVAEEEVPQEEAEPPGEVAQEDHEASGDEDIPPVPATGEFFARPAEDEPVDLAAEPTEAPAAKPAPPSRGRRWTLRLGAATVVALVLVVLWLTAFGGLGSIREDLRQRQFESAAAAVTPGIDWITMPDGMYEMGSEDGETNEGPVHRVWLESYRISRAEITVGQYWHCVHDGMCSEPGTGRTCNWGEPERVEHPVNCVTWFQATEFAFWADARLPSEAEWEYAARNLGLKLAYPWGQWEPSCELTVAEPDRCETTGTAPACGHLKGNTAQGLCDMAGNVAEWVADAYHETYDGAPANGHAWGSPAGVPTVVRGGSWDSAFVQLGVTRRQPSVPTTADAAVGFRIVETVEEPVREVPPEPASAE